ncbi:MAG: hypothetical protein IPK83_03010 [Planctomycetes bacterium]|nr:hypothetical protein [Planctomycetota bacterium]
MLEIVLVAICVYLHFQSEYFLTSDNLMLVLRNSAEIGIIAFAHDHGHHRRGDRSERRVGGGVCRMPDGLSD